MEEITPDYMKHLYNSICKILFKHTRGSGFFMKTKVKIKLKNITHFLITNSHIITENMINKKETITIFLENINEKREIILDNEKRLIKCFKKPVDITIIEILDEDNLKGKINCLKKGYLENNEGYEKYLDQNIFILHHPEGKETLCSRGKIKSINDFEFMHDSFTTKGSSGSPIILVDELKIIGIHKRKNKQNNDNQGVFIDKLIEELTDSSVKEFSHKVENNLANIYNIQEPAPLINEIEFITLRYKFKKNSKKIKFNYLEIIL